ALSLRTLASERSVLLHVSSALSFFFFFSSRRRHTRLVSDWSSDVCSSDLSFPPAMTDPGTRGRPAGAGPAAGPTAGRRLTDPPEIGRASCRERGEISGGAGAVKKKKAERGERGNARRGDASE